eukprot:44508_1
MLMIPVHSRRLCYLKRSPVYRIPRSTQKLRTFFNFPTDFQLMGVITTPNTNERLPTPVTQKCDSCCTRSLWNSRQHIIASDRSSRSGFEVSARVHAEVYTHAPAPLQSFG